MPTPLPVQNIPTAFASSANPTVTSVNLGLFGITPTTPGMLQHLGPPHLRLINYTPALLSVTFNSSGRHYVGPLDEVIFSLQPDDLAFSYTPVGWLPNQYNYNNVLLMTYYAAGESVPPRTVVQQTTTPYDVWSGGLDTHNANPAVPANGASVNVGGLFSVAGTLNIPCVVVLRSILLEWDGQGAAAGGIKYQIGVDLQTAGNVSLGGSFPYFFITYNNDWPAVAGPYAGLNYVLNKPWASPSFTPTGTADHFTMIFHTIAKTNAPPNLLLNIQADVVLGAFFTPNNT